MAGILTDGGRWEKEITEKRYGRWLIPFFVSQKSQKGLHMSGNGHTDITENTDFNWSLRSKLKQKLYLKLSKGILSDDVFVFI